MSHSHDLAVDWTASQQELYLKHREDTHSCTTSQENIILLYWLVWNTESILVIYYCISLSKSQHSLSLKLLVNVSQNNSTTVPPPWPRPLWPRSGVEPEPSVCGWVGGGVVGDWVPWDPWTETPQCHIPHPSPFEWRFTTPAGQWAGGPRPAGGWRGKWVDAGPEIDWPPSSPQSTSLPIVQDGDAMQSIQLRQST